VTTDVHPAFSLAAETLDNEDFLRLAAFIESYCGIKMPETKRSMMEGRLRKRLRDLGMRGFSEYCYHLFDGGGLEEEVVYLIDAITTNKTDFFREPKHFTHLVEKALPSLRADGIDYPLRVWSAASSIGAEAYTIAMILDDYARSVPGFSFDIIGTDICTEVLDQACQAIYPLSMIETVPDQWRARYFMRSIAGTQPTIRVRPNVRSSVRFGRLNLMENFYPLDYKMDVIFCRNILIYFGRATQEAVLMKICQNLRSGGYLYIGHGESVTGMTLPLAPVSPSVFRRI